jgi:3-deoxy-D-manno-octulosonic-acid transferase
MQDEVYRQRLLDLNVDESRTEVTGNMKYDNVRLQQTPREPGRIREWLSGDGRLVLVCGSTHADEEVWMVEAANEVKSRLGIPMRVVLAPRHPERAVGVRDSLAQRGWDCTMWSSHIEAHRDLAEEEILIVDTIGHLEKFYAACDVAFVGGSLIPRGGQNMVEAAAMGKAVLFGPHVSNFRRDVQLLLEADAACQVTGRGELVTKLAELCGDTGLRTGLGERAVALIRRNQGSTQRTLETLAPLLGSAPT